jgi:ferric-dicitrate binding protein FerR (iron transport regulator)
MSKQSFDYLIEKYLDGAATDAEKKLVEQWYALVGNSSQIPTSSKEWATIKERVWRKVSLQTFQQRISTFTSTKILKIFAAAATIIFAIGMMARFFTIPTEPTISFSKTNELVTISNSDKEAKRITLPDNSVITLQKNASVTYLRNFDKKQREVKLSGEAFFEVTKDSTRPFVVEAANTITRVLGTSFTVKEENGEKVQVEVRNGLVSVYDKKSTDKKNNGVLLTANQKVTFHKNENHFVIGLVEEPKPIAKEAKVSYSLKYEDASLAVIKEELEQLYGINILFEKSITGKCKITGDLSGESLYDTLDVISLILNTDYRVQGTNILITGEGC